MGRGAAIAFFLLVLAVVGGIVGYDVIKNDRLNLNGKQPGVNWKWSDDWNKNNPQEPVQPPVNPPVTPPVNPQPQQQQLIASSYSEAIRLSGEHGMPVLVFFEASWCSWCKKMKADTMNSPNVAGVMKNYILVYVDVDRDRQTARRFSVTGIPAYVITNVQQANLKSGSGYKEPYTFSGWLNEPRLFRQPKGPGNPDPRQPDRRPRRQQPPQT